MSTGIEEQIVWTKEASGGDFERLEVLEAGEYPAVLTAIKTVAKPENRLTGKENEDLSQWEWRFDLTDEDLTAYNFRKWTSRSLHEKSNAYAIIKGMGAELPEDGVPYSLTSLIGSKCRLVLKTYDKTLKDGTTDERNYIDSWLPPKKARSASRTPQVGTAPDSDPLGLSGRFKAAYSQYSADHSKEEAKANYGKLVTDNTPFRELTVADQTRVVEWYEAHTQSLDDIEF